MKPGAVQFGPQMMPRAMPLPRRFEAHRVWFRRRSLFWVAGTVEESPVGAGVRPILVITVGPIPVDKLRIPPWTGHVGHAARLAWG